jgi:predicted dehydrogenase
MERPADCGRATLHVSQFSCAFGSTRVYGRVRNAGQFPGELTGTVASRSIQIRDGETALLIESGALCFIEAATSAYPGLLKRTEIHGDRGSARVEQDDLTLWEFQEKVPSDNEVYAAMAGQTGFKAGASDPRGITHIGHRDQLIDFLEAIDTGRAPQVDGREGRKSVEIIRAIYRSAQTHTSVELPLDDEG